MTQGSSAWLASRLVPARTVNGRTVWIDNKIINNNVSRTISSAHLGSAHGTALLGMDASQNIINLAASAASLVWRGLWVINNQPIIGENRATTGLIVPFNTFNVGYRYRRGWRPSVVS